MTQAATPVRTPVLHRPLASYYLVLVSTMLLLSIGFVMVLSASSVRSYSTYGNSYAIALKQGIFIAIGLPCLWGASRIPARGWRLLGTPILLAAVALLVLVLVPGFGRTIDGATRWIALPGGFNLQPSELAKLGIALWGADLLVRKKKLLRDWKHLLLPLLPVAGLLVALVMLEPDMGTTIVLSATVMTLLWVVGTPGRVFGAIAAVALTLGAVMAVAEPYRLQRLVSFSDPCADHQRLDAGFQACQGLLALSSGGWFGVGLGASAEKWAGGLPNPYTDYVFAIVGEELGLLGTLSVLMLFGTLAYAGIRIAKRSTDPFSRLVAAAITAWISVQALINMGTVVGLVPITGIPLPLVSFGGSALISTLASLGMLLSFARNEPGARQALAARDSRLRSLIAPLRTRVRPASAAGRPQRAPARSASASAAARRNAGPASSRKAAPASSPGASRKAGSSPSPSPSPSRQPSPAGRRPVSLRR